MFRHPGKVCTDAGHPILIFARNTADKKDAKEVRSRILSHHQIHIASNHREILTNMLFVPEI